MKIRLNDARSKAQHNIMIQNTRLRLNMAQCISQLSTGRGKGERARKRREQRTVGKHQANKRAAKVSERTHERMDHYLRPYHNTVSILAQRCSTDQLINGPTGTAAREKRVIDLPLYHAQ